MKRTSQLTISVATLMLAILGAAALLAQGQDKGKNNDKYALKSPSGIAFSDFRGYEDWADVSSARTDEIIKVIDHDQSVQVRYPGQWPAFSRRLHDRQAPMDPEEEH